MHLRPVKNRRAYTSRPAPETRGGRNRFRPCIRACARPSVQGVYRAGRSRPETSFGRVGSLGVCNVHADVVRSITPSSPRIRARSAIRLFLFRGKFLPVSSIRRFEILQNKRRVDDCEYRPTLLRRCHLDVRHIVITIGDGNTYTVTPPYNGIAGDQQIFPI